MGRDNRERHNDLQREQENSGVPHNRVVDLVVFVVVYLTLTDPLRIQPWSQHRRNQTKSNRKSEISRESRQKRTDKKVASVTDKYAVQCCTYKYLLYLFVTRLVDEGQHPRLLVIIGGSRSGPARCTTSALCLSGVGEGERLNSLMG